MARVQLSRDEIVERLSLLLGHAPRLRLQRLATFVHLSLRGFKHLLASDVELDELVRAAPLAARSTAPLDFETKHRLQRAVLAIDRLGGPHSGWRDDMHPEYQPCP